MDRFFEVTRNRIAKRAVKLMGAAVVGMGYGAFAFGINDLLGAIIHNEFVESGEPSVNLFASTAMGAVGGAKLGAMAGALLQSYPIGGFDFRSLLLLSMIIAPAVVVLANVLGREEFLVDSDDFKKDTKLGIKVGLEGLFPSFLPLFLALYHICSGFQDVLSNDEEPVAHELEALDNDIHRIDLI